ncbi:MAG: hypothetical protein R3F02_17555 [Thiolinea sp.]
MQNHRIQVLLALLLITGMTHSGPLLATTRAEQCAAYARTAVDQNQTNKRVKCNYTGPRWSDDFAAQQRWCMTVRPAISAAENQARDRLLNACYANKADVKNRQYPLIVPGACRYNPQGYQPVRYYFTRSAYNADPEVLTAVPGGLITTDFNKDHKNDYIFLERSPAHKFRIILCMSQNNSWKRLPLFDVTEDTSDYYAISGKYVSLNDDGKLQIDDGYNEHNLGSRSLISEYSYSPQAEEFLLDTYTESFSTGDGTQANYSTVKDYVKGEIRETVDCSSLMEDFRQGCVQKDNVITPMKPPEYSIDKRRFR